MYRKMSSSPSISSRFALVTALIGILVVSAACQGTAEKPSNPTATAVIENLSTPQQSTRTPTELATQVPTALSADTKTKVNICSLVPSAEVEVVLGQPILSIDPISKPDSATGDMVDVCTYLGNDATVLISSIETPSAQAGAEMLKSQLAIMQAADSSITPKQETGLGDQVFWTVSENGAVYTVLKDNHVFSVLLYGDSIGDPASHKAALLKLAEAVAPTQ